MPGSRGLERTLNEKKPKRSVTDLTCREVRELRDGCREGLNYGALANRYNVSRDEAHLLATGKLRDDCGGKVWRPTVPDWAREDDRERRRR